jgi:hypothetical protein
MLTLNHRRFRMKRLLTLTVVLIFALGASPCWSEIPHLISYQGMLIDNAGDPLNGDYQLTFSIYDQPSGGTALWTEVHDGVTIEDGLFNVILGSDIALASSVFDDTVRYLGIKVGTDQELTPRLRLTSVGYAYRAEWADTAAYAQVSATSEADSDWTISGSDMYSAVTGNIGIGTTSPNAVLEVVGTGIADHLRLTNTSNPGPAIYLNAANKDWVIWGTNPGADAGDKSLVFRDYTAAQNRMMIDSLGNVGIGTVNPSQMLDVAGTVQMLGFKMPTNASDGYILTSDADGRGSWQPASGGTSRWTLTDSVLYTNDYWGIARGGAGNAVYNDSAHTMVNFGVSCTTGLEVSAIYYSTVSGGSKNAALNSWCTVGGGERNRASGGHATISGGYINNATREHAAVLGGRGNTAGGWAATVGGGLDNTAGALYAGVFSGYSNLAGNQETDTAAFVGGGYDNSATGDYSTVSGGQSNTASGDSSTIAGGTYNLASGQGSTIGGGNKNTSSSGVTTVGGGRENTANYTGATIAGGYSNVASGWYSMIGGGQANSAAEQYVTVGGGFSNAAQGRWSTIAGGYQNAAGNQIGDSAAFVGGGSYNAAIAMFGTVCGGHGNYNEGDYSVICGGLKDTLTSVADYSLTFGRGVYLGTSYRVAFFDGSYYGNLGINRDDREGGINYPIHVGTNTNNGNGAYLSNGGTWTGTSSRLFKENFQSLDGEELLLKITNMPVLAWEYKNSDERHIGPMAEDFVEAFDVGTIREDGTRENKYLASGDVAGVALAGVKELIQQNQELRQTIEELRQRITKLESKE